MSYNVKMVPVVYQLLVSGTVPNELRRQPAFPTSKLVILVLNPLYMGPLEQRMLCRIGFSPFMS